MALGTGVYVVTSNGAGPCYGIPHALLISITAGLVGVLVLALVSTALAVAVPAAHGVQLTVGRVGAAGAVSCAPSDTVIGLPQTLDVGITGCVGGVSIGTLLTALSSTPHTSWGIITLRHCVELVAVSVANTKLPIPETFIVTVATSSISILQDALYHAPVDANIAHAILKAYASSMPIAV